MAKRHFQVSDQQRVELVRAYDAASEPDVQRRLQAIRLYGDGWAVEAIQEISGCSERSIRRWLAAYERGGLLGIVDKRSGGNNAKLTKGQRAEVIRRLQTERPDQRLSPEVRISRGAFWSVSDLQIGLYQWYGVCWRSATSYRTLLHESRLSIQQVESRYRSRPAEATIADFEIQLEKK